ncbi:hypothetical protein [Mycolicibacterium aubagnense]|uniref:Lipoprotein n=1 Tax=Mycolicibacterium aubagnense TaxID=319707 RepID=A0ABM7IM79_9MYCO|nr:hypothetical protein [Mycolicibacterium aubagnense]TLH64263.1 hypothetical protein C1S80_12690 [Mycolicibacterium aubagnense]BBX87906.1 hypothetical protein MAUB_57790 [Mycolicibacterium aubagnense]
MSRPKFNPRALLRGRHPAAVLAAIARRRRQLVWLLATLGALSAVACGVLAVCSLLLVVLSPAAAPVAIAGKVLSNVADLFGDGQGEDSISGRQLPAAGDGGSESCRPLPPPGLAVSSGELSSAPPSADPPTPSPATGIAAITVGADGSLDRTDAAALIAPIPLRTSALRAHVWFLYRMSGLGDWDRFTAAYRDARLSDDDKRSDAPLQQVQALNTVGADIERYRLTAAALVTAGERTGLLSDPYPDYQQLVATELVSSCFDNSSAEDARMTLPPPATTIAQTPPPPAVTAADSENVPKDRPTG